MLWIYYDFNVDQFNCDNKPDNLSFIFCSSPILEVIMLG